MTVDDKAVANGTFSCEAIVKVKPVRLCIETLDTKAKMLQLLHSPKPVADDDSEGKSTATWSWNRRKTLFRLCICSYSTSYAVQQRTDQPRIPCCKFSFKVQCRRATLRYFTWPI